MTSRPSVATTSDPFSDTAALSDIDHDTNNILESTLPVGKDASLTLTADGVIVTGKFTPFARAKHSLCSID